MNTEEAYRRCEAITRSSAANFYYGIRLLAPERRRAMCAVYAFARRVDDIGDGGLAPDQKLRLLDEQARALMSLGENTSQRTDPAAPTAHALPLEGRSTSRRSAGPRDRPDADPVMVGLGDAYARFVVPPDALPALIAGVRMDVEGVEYESFEDLVLYCRRVAGAIGRACLAIFALRDPTGMDLRETNRLADDLGVALQLINILRDIREDAQNERVYLPAEDLHRFGVSASGKVLDDPGRLAELIGFEAERAQEWFERGIALAGLLDRRSAACLLAMAGIYRRLLSRIVADPERVLRERVSLPIHEKAWVAARSMLGGGS